jgi:hypothetical protein
MKFRMIELGYKSTPDYPYDYRIELTEYSLRDRKHLTDWLKDLAIPHTTAGGLPGSVIYLRREHATMFALRWS